MTKKPKFVVYKDTYFGMWYWSLVTGNWKVIAQATRGYRELYTLKRALKILYRSAEFEIKVFR